MSAEILVPYVQRLLASHQEPTVDGFLDSLLTPNEKFMYDIIFNFSLALHVFRAGVRWNNSDAILASRSVFSPLFFGLNMPFYMEALKRNSLIIGCNVLLKSVSSLQIMNLTVSVATTAKAKGEILI